MPCLSLKTRRQLARNRNPAISNNQSIKARKSTDRSKNGKNNGNGGINRSATFYDLFYLLKIGRKADPFLLFFGRKPGFDHVAEKGF